MNFTPKIVASCKRGNNSGSRVNDTILISVIKSGKKRLQVGIRFGQDVMKHQRWLVGDRVVVQLGTLEDGRPAMSISRTMTGGHKLSGVKSQVGKMAYASVKVSNEDFLEEIKPYAGTNAKPHVMPDGSLIVVLEKRDATCKGGE
jgi:hypothetical protein